MAELIDKKLVLKDIASWAVGCDPQEAVMVNVESVGMSIEQLPYTTEAEIRAKAIDEFFDELQKYEDDDWLKLKMSSIYEIAEQLKGE